MILADNLGHFFKVLLRPEQVGRQQNGRPIRAAGNTTSFASSLRFGPRRAPVAAPNGFDEHTMREQRFHLPHGLSDGLRPGYQ
jgi:hypothetical protein